METTNYSKEKAILIANEFVKGIHFLQKKYNMKLNSDCNLHLSYYNNEKPTYRESIKIGWEGDGSDLKVLEKTKEHLRQQALSKLTNEEKEVLGLL